MSERQAPPRAGLVRYGLLNRLLLAVGSDEGIDQAEQLLLGLRRHALDEFEATFEASADGGCGRLALGADAEQLKWLIQVRLPGLIFCQASVRHRLFKKLHKICVLMAITGHRSMFLR
jgi:hypothetical protein